MSKFTKLLGEKICAVIDLIAVVEIAVVTIIGTTIVIAIIIQAVAVVILLQIAVVVGQEHFLTQLILQILYFSF